MAQYPGYQSGISNNNNAPCPSGQRIYQGSRSRNLVAINPGQLEPFDIEEWQAQEEEEEPRAIYIGSRSFARIGPGQRQGQELMLPNGFQDNDSDVSNYYALSRPNYVDARRRGSGGFLNSQAGSSSQDYNVQIFNPQQPPQPCMFQNEFVGVPRIFPGQQQPLQSSLGSDYQTVNVIKTLWRTRCKKKKKCCNPCGCPIQPCCKPSCCQPCYQPCCKPKKCQKKCYREMLLVKANNNDPCKESENIYLVKSVVNCKRKPSCVQQMCCNVPMQQQQCQQQCQPTCCPQPCYQQQCQKVCCKISNPCDPCKSMMVCCQKVECPCPPPPSCFNPCNPCCNPCNPCNPCNNPCPKPCCPRTQICLPPCPPKQQPCTMTTNTIPLQDTMSKCYLSPMTENCCTIQECCDVCPPPCPPKKTPDMCCFEEEDDCCPCPEPPPRRCSPPPSICTPSPPPSTVSDDPPTSICPPPPKKCKPSCPKPCKPQFVCPPSPPRRPVNICFQPQDICCQQQQQQQGRPCNFGGSTVACNTECVFSRPIDFGCTSRPCIPYERQESCSNVESSYELYWTGNAGNVGQDSGGNRSNKMYSRWNC